MAKPNTGPRDLGQLPAIKDGRLEPPTVLWSRFGVREEQRERNNTIYVSVEDLEQKLGEGPAHRLDILLINAPPGPAHARLQRALRVQSNAQLHVYATAVVGDKLALICEPMIGVPFRTALEAANTGTGGGAVARPARLERSKLLLMAVELTELLAKLHEVGVHGVHFAREGLRVDDGHYSLDGFTHVLGEARAPQRDLEALLEFLRQLGDESAERDLRDLPPPTSARALWKQLLALREADDNLRPFELPVDPPFVGRTAAFATLEAGISQAKIAKPTAIIVEGERGIGKSRLLREFVASYMQSEEVLVLTGAWQAQTGDTRSGLLGALEQLTRFLPSLEPDERDDIRRRINRATKHLGAILARSAPALGAVLRHAEELPQLELGGDFSRHTAVIADVLKAIGTRQRPLILVLDNVESADANSAAVLEIIAQTRPAHYTLVVMGLRTGAHGYSPEFEAERIKLVPLNVEEIEELLERTLPGKVENAPALAEILSSASNGLPLALAATLRSWVDRGRLARGDDGVWRARRALQDKLDEEPNIRDLFSSRLTGAPESVKRIALEIAVFGVDLPHADLVEIGEDVEEAVRDLCDRGILVKTETGVRFPHDTVRELVLDSFSEAEQRAAHRQAAAILSKRGAPIPQIVYHRDLGFDTENEPHEAFDRLSRLHVEAGRERLDIYDLERARWHLERALEHSHDAEQRGVAAEGLADVCLLQDDLDTAVALYTAIIATAKPFDAVRVAAKATQFLYGKNANTDARLLGNMALETAEEPTPATPLGKLWTLFTSLARPLFGECKLEADLRDALCKLYTFMLYASLIDDPVGVPMFAARGRWIAIGLETGSAAVMRSLEAGLSTVLGFFKHADQVFALSIDIANKSKDAWAQGMVFHHWGGALLALDRYSEGQDRLDDGIAAFRETGDVSIALISMYYKSIYGRDREHADVVLGWIDEALTTARRNGKRSAVLTLQSLKLHILARQGRTDLDERLEAQAAATEGEYGMERLASHIELAYAYLELSNFDRALVHVRAAQADADEMGGTVPEFCQEVHYVAALVMLARPLRTRTERKALRSAIRKFRRALKRAPRLRVVGDLLDLKLALHANNNTKAQNIASRIVSDFDTHENLHAARQAHRALARLLKGDNVLAAAEHERLARNLGRRLGLPDHVLLSDFSELGREVGIIALTEESELNLEESQPEIGGAGMLTSAVGRKSKRRRKTETDFDDQSDVLAAWLTTTETPRVSLGSIIGPVRAAVSSSIEVQNLEISCPNPDLEVPFASGDLQILLINMLLACRDAVGSRIKVSAWLEEIQIETSELARVSLSEPGHYLSIQVSASGGGTQIPVIGAFPTCESLAHGLGGTLSASTDRGKVSLRAYIGLDRAPELSDTTPNIKVLVVHPDPTVRETIGSALDELGVWWQQAEPDDFGPGELDQVSVIIANDAVLRALRTLQPLSTTRLIEIVKRGAAALSPQYETLQVPFAMSELEELVLQSGFDFESSSLE
jgi:hypothetical protein